MERLDGRKLQGIVVPTVTPLNEREEVQLDALRKLNEHMMKGGVHGLFPLGTTGEFARMDDEQKEQVARVTIEQAAGRVPVYVGVGDTGTRKVLRNMKKAHSWGADVIVSTLPYYYPVNDEREQLQYFEAIAASTDLPVMMYNMPATVGVNIAPSVVERLSHVPNIIGIKDSSGNYDYIHACLRIKKASSQVFQIFVGDESLSARALLAGADGLVPSLGNVFPKLLVQLYEACAAKEHERAEDLQQELSIINQFNKVGDSWLGALILRKKLLSMMGLSPEKVSHPSLAMDSAADDKLDRFIKKWA
ncbi:MULTISPECIES: dihydrodipicolinate synthase family protein [unclassified Paenibacillus]|uniref:dihydrodipicolinate synthase family protein n=1 Tax=unclassified Paenibacillus TaxID=185978 RepID=UPI002F42B024